MLDVEEEQEKDESDGAEREIEEKTISPRG